MSEWSQALSAPAIAGSDPVPTISGNRGLQIEEPLLFEQDSPGHCGVDLPEPAAAPEAERITSQTTYMVSGIQQSWNEATGNIPCGTGNENKGRGQGGFSHLSSIPSKRGKTKEV